MGESLQGCLEKGIKKSTFGPLFTITLYLKCLGKVFTNSPVCQCNISDGLLVILGADEKSGMFILIPQHSIR